MRNQYLAGLMEQREQIATAIESYTNRALERGSALTDAEMNEVRAWQEQATAIDGQLSTFAEAQAANRNYSELMGRLDRGHEERAAQTQRTEASMETLGGLFAGSEEYRGYARTARGTSAVFEASDMDLESRAPTNTGGIVMTPTRVVWPEPSDAGLYPLFGLVDVQSISGNAFDYVQSTFDDNADVVAEGALKPESTYTETLVSDTLQTIAHWTQLTRQALEDSARVRSVVDGKLTKGVLRKEHDMIADALVAATLPAVTGGGDLLAAIRVGIGTVQAAGWTPNAVLLNPADWAALDVAIMGGTLNGPTIGTTFWGLRPVAYRNQAAGTATVGAFDEGLTLFRRSGVSVFATDSHADTFISNIFTILAEARAKAVVTDVSAFAEATAGVLTTASSSGSGSGSSK